MRAIGQALRGIAAAVGARPWLFVSVALSVFALNILVPPLVLSIARKPVTAFTINPLLSTLPDYLMSGRGAFEERLSKIWGLALFWFSADNPFGVEWGFAVTMSDLARFLLMALIIGAYFALWFHRRDRLAPARAGARASAHGGMLGAVSSVFGLATGGCTVMGCGAPVMPVVGLAFAGLSSTTLKWMAEISTVATAAVLIGMGTGVLYLAWRAGATPS